MKKKGYYSSGEFARMAHVTLRTIRYYDKQDLLKPSFVTESGARFYTDSDFARLSQILLLKYLGFSLDDIREMMGWDGIMGLGEMMSFPNVIGAEENIHAELAETLKSDNIITGHFSIPDTGAALNAYIASGIRCCHESTRAEDVLEKMRHGMYALMRYGSAWHDMPVIIKAVLDNKIDDRFACLISDDTHPDTLINEGHLDHIVRCAIREGLDPIKAIQYVTINVATCFRMDHEMGSITPGKCADIVFFDDLNDIRITRTIIDGDVVAENGQMCVEIQPAHFPESVCHTMHVGHPITAESFRIPAPAGAGESVRTRAIEIIPNRVGNYERLLDLPVKDGFVEPDTAQDVMKMVVFERHHETGTKGAGFLKGFGFRKGAMAQTVSHDAHNLLVAGTNDADMALAANTLIECGGGMCAVADGKVLAVVPLPIAGLMNDLPVREMAELVSKLDAAWKQMGCVINSPYMTMALVPLACLPELRLTNRGLVDCRTFQFVPLFAEGLAGSTFSTESEKRPPQSLRRALRRAEKIFSPRRVQFSERFNVQKTA